MKTNTLITTVLLLLITVYGYSQGVGVNNDGTMPDSSAVLDVKSTDKGMLIPRVSLNDTDDVATITNPATSLIVHNSNASMDGGNGVGLYQWNGSKWVKLVSPTNGPGADGDVLTSKGAGQAPTWKTAASGGGGCLNKIQIYDTPGSYTWTRPAGVDVVYVTLAGGGGGGAGGGGGYGGSNTESGGGGAGGGGGAETIFDWPYTVTGNVAVVVGAGGTGGTGGAGGSGGNGSAGADGNDGGDSSFGTLTAGKGGKGLRGYGGNTSNGQAGHGGPNGAGRSVYSNGAWTHLSAFGRNGSSGGAGGDGEHGEDLPGPSVLGGASHGGSGGGRFAPGLAGGNVGYGGGGGGGGASGLGSGGNGSTDAPSSGEYGGGGGGGNGGHSSNGTGSNGADGGDGADGVVIIQWSE